MKYNTSQGSLKEEEKHNSGDASVAVGAWTPSRTTAPHPKIEMHVSRPGSPAGPSSPSPFPWSPSKHTQQSVRAKKLSMRSFLWLRPELQHGQQGDYASSLYAQLLPVLAVNLGSINVGLALAFPTILVPQLVPLQSRGTNSTQGLMEESAMQQWVGSFFLLGAVLGGILTSVQGSLTGRRSTLLSCAISDLLGWSVLALASLLPQVLFPLILTGRLLKGVAAAGYISTIQIYVAEVVQTEHRGWMGGLSLPLVCIGMMAMYVLGSLIPWYHTALVCLVPPVLLIAFLSQLWDTPYFYLMQYREKDGHAAMDKLRTGDPGAVAEIFTIQEAVDDNRIDEGILPRLYLLCTQKKYYTPFFILNFLILVIVFTGVTSMNIYANELFQRAGDHMSSYLSNIVIGLLQLAGSCLFLPLVKQYSRKLLLVSSAIIMSFSLALLGLYLYSQTRYEQFFMAVSRCSWLAILCFSGFLLAAPIGLCSVPLLYTAELFPTEMRSLLSGLTTSICCLAIFTGHHVFHALEMSLQPHGAVWISCAACVIAVFVTLCCVPETRSKQLTQIPEKFAEWRKEARASPWITPLPTPSHSRCATPTREVKKFEFRTQMFTK